MAEGFSVGQRVRHRQFGAGKVESVMAGGVRYRVYFASVSTSKIIERAFLEPDGARGVAPPVAAQPVSAPTPPPPVVAPSPPKGPGAPVETRPSEEDLRARLALECLRQGLPPPGGVRGWTVGLKEVQTQIGAALEDAASRARGSVVVVEGSYGQGKSHVGRWARELALSRQVATMSVDLDGGGVSLANSSRLLAHLFASLRVPNGNGAGDPVPGLGTLLREAAGSGRGVPRGCEEFRPFLGDAARWEGNEEAIEVLEEYLGGELAKSKADSRLAEVGLRFALPALRLNYGTLGERLVAQGQQLARVVSLARACGAKAGLVVVDEVDHEFAEGDVHRSQRAFDTIRAWGKEFASQPVVLLLLAPPELDGWPPVCRRVQLPGLTKSELKSLTEKVVEAYRKVRPEIVVRDGVERLFRGLFDDFSKRYRDEGWGPRYFVRATVEACETAVEQGSPLESVLG